MWVFQGKSATICQRVLGVLCLTPHLCHHPWGPWMDLPSLYLFLPWLTSPVSVCLFTIFITLFSHHPLLRFLVCQWPSMTCTDTLFLRAFRHKLMSLSGTNTEIKQTLHPCSLVHSPIIKHLGDCKSPLWCSCSSHPFSPCPVSLSPSRALY